MTHGLLVNFSSRGGGGGGGGGEQAFVVGINDVIDSVHSDGNKFSRLSR